MTAKNPGDYTTNANRLVLLSLLAAIIGILAGLLSFLLLRLIGLFTHLAYFGRVGWTLVAPNPNHFGAWSIAIPVVGGLLVGMLAKFGSDKIRGHGIPETILAMLGSESKMGIRVAVLKPLASAIAIGTGGPFGAEGPIITTGGAIGSLIAQLFTLSSMERRTLLVAGAAAGMAAVFAAPVAAILLAIELLIFEWRPRSLIPIAIACTLAEVVRVPLLGSTAIFLAPLRHSMPASVLVIAVGIGLASGVAAGLLSKSVYAVEDWYGRLALHWMWWPALGGVVVGVGGLIDPLALGVGYPTIRSLDNGQLLWQAAALLLIVKAVIWVWSLGSGTSGGVLAPLLLLGGALGTLCGALLPGHPTAAGATLGMTAMLGGALEVPFTAVIFTLETTRDWALLLPATVAALTAMTVTVLWLPRSILTEKVARRGRHVSREYAVHPLDYECVRDLMLPWEQVVGLPAELSIDEARAAIIGGQIPSHRSYPVLDWQENPVGVIRRATLLSATESLRSPAADLSLLMTELRTADGSEPARTVLQRFIDFKVPGLVVKSDTSPVGWITQDLLLGVLLHDVANEDWRPTQ